MKRGSKLLSSSLPLAAFLACAPSAPAPKTEVAAASSSAAPASPAATPVVTPCARAAASTEKALHALHEKYPAKNDAPSQSLVGWCTEGAWGAWWIDAPAADALAKVNDVYDLTYVLEGRFTVVFEPPTGAASRFVPKETLSNYGVRTKKTPIVYDFDHDGVPELFVEVDEEGDEGHRAIQRDLLAFRDGAIALYAPAAAIDYDTMRDVDTDGIPDLVLSAGYSDALESCGSGFPMGFMDDLFVAHAHADGTFALDDDVAKSFAKKSCPAAPKKIAGSVDAICARLWAKTDAEIKAARALVYGSCTPWSCELEMAGAAQHPNAAIDCARRASFFLKKPPFNLP